jgi:hypothetical protein
MNLKKYFLFNISTTISKDYGNSGFAPKVEYCYSLSECESDVKTSIGLGVNKFFNSDFDPDFDPFNVYAIGKIVLPVYDKGEFSFGTNVGYGIFNSKYETAQETFKADKVYSVKVFVKFGYKNLFVDLSAMTNIIPIDAKITTVNEGVKRLKESINYNAIMLGIGYKARNLKKTVLMRTLILDTHFNPKRQYNRQYQSKRARTSKESK